MASTRRKSAAVALAVIGVAGLSLAAAAQLNVTSNTLQAGSDLDVTCQTTPVTVSYTTSYLANAYTVTAVNIGTFGTGCIGKDIAVTLVGTTGPVELEGTVAATTVLPVTGVTAEALTGIAVVVSGA